MPSQKYSHKLILTKKLYVMTVGGDEDYMSGSQSRRGVICAANVIRTPYAMMDKNEICNTLIL